MGKVLAKWHIRGVWFSCFITFYTSQGDIPRPEEEPRALG
jgi:hypothetical protein